MLFTNKIITTKFQQVGLAHLRLMQHYVETSHLICKSVDSFLYDSNIYPRWVNPTQTKTNLLEFPIQQLLEKQILSKDLARLTLFKPIKPISHSFACSEIWRLYGWKFSLKQIIDILFKGPLLGLRRFLATESPLKVMKNTFYFMLKVHFVLKIFKFLS